MTYLRAQMLYDDMLHYNWNEGEHTNGNFLDRTNGNQVLEFINSFASNHHITALKELQEIEFLIRYGTPTNVQTPAAISELLRSKLEDYHSMAV